MKKVKSMGQDSNRELGSYIRSRGKRVLSKGGNVKLPAKQFKLCSISRQEGFKRKMSVSKSLFC